MTNSAAILGLGEHRPSRVVTNADLARRIDTTDEWIRERTGIASRRRAGDGESVVDMAVRASAKALAAAGVRPDEVGLVLVATSTHPYQTPAAACEVASLLGTSGAGATDVGAGCAGFSYALAFAADAVRTGSSRYVVVAGSERLTDFLDWDDRVTSCIFGDGAGAAVVGPAEEPGIGPVVWGSDGARADLIGQTCSWIDFADSRGLGRPVLRMDGPAVFRWTTTQLAPVARRACELAGIEPADLAAFVPHQANLRIIEVLARTLGASRAVVARDVVDMGNTSAASVPLALSRLLAQGDVARGDPALLLGFGAGLSFAGQVVLCP